MFFTLLKKEILDYLISVRFVILIALCVLLVPLSLYVNFETYQRWSADYNEQLKIESELRSGGRSSGMTGVRPPSPISVFANGIETSLAKDFSLQQNQIALGKPRSFGDPVYEIFGRIDYLFVVQSVLSLIALLFAFDAVSGEKELGTLKLCLANSVPRYKVLLGKLAGGMLVLSAPFLLAFGIGLSLLAAAGYPLFENTILFKVVLMLILSVIYISIFFLLGLLVSALTHQSKTALILLMFVWVVLVLGIPRLSVMAARVIRPVDDDSVVLLRKRLIVENLQKEKGNALKELYFAKAREKGVAQGAIMFDAKDPEFVRRRNEIARPFEARMREELARIDEDQQRKRQWQLDLARSLARSSPASTLAYLMTDIADTGEQVKVKFLDAVRVHYANMDRLVFSKGYQDRITDGDNSWGFGGDLPGEAKPKDPPRFNFAFPPTTSTVAQSLTDVALLMAYAIILLALSMLVFIQYDVR